MGGLGTEPTWGLLKEARIWGPLGLHFVPSAPLRSQRNSIQGSNGDQTSLRAEPLQTPHSKSVSKVCSGSSHLSLPPLSPWLSPTITKFPHQCHHCLPTGPPAPTVAPFSLHPHCSQIEL
jgi:hypothetical protein